MRYPPHLLDEIRARLPVSTVVGRKVRLKKAGREWRGLSPFNAEKTPSFYANDQKQFYHDFSSGKHGDVFTFLIETEGLSFPEAVERLAAEAGVDLPRLSGPEAERAVEARRGLQDVVEAACRFFEGQLAGSGGRGARAYLERRGVSGATQAEFRIGLAPDGRTALLDHLRGKGIADDLILQAGLAVAPEDGRGSGRGLYDRFRGRVVFPIQDRDGKVVAFGGRALAEGQQPKYLNSPETELFRKGQLVFNGHRARPASRKDQRLAVVEGYVDAIAAWQAGHKAVVATLGTAFTEEQIEALWRIDPEPVLCFDGDRAGRAAAFRALDRMLPQLAVGRSFRFAFLPDGQDPDDVIRAAGLPGFRASLDDALRLWDVLWAREIDGVNAGDPDGVARLHANLRRIISGIGDTQLRFRYELTAKLSVNELAYKATRRRFQQPTETSGGVLLRATRLFAGEPTRQTATERIFLGLCVAFPDLAAQKVDDISRLRFRGRHKAQDGADQPLQVFADELFRLIEEDPDVRAPGDVYDRLNPVFYGLLDVLYGSTAENRPSGHALQAAFPPFGYVTDPAYFSRFFRDCLRRLEVREMEDHLQEDMDHLLASADPEAGIDDVDRLAALQAEIHRLRDLSLAEENELAEIAEAYRPRLSVAA